MGVWFLRIPEYLLPNGLRFSKHSRVLHSPSAKPSSAPKFSGDSQRNPSEVYWKVIPIETNLVYRDQKPRDNRHLNGKPEPNWFRVCHRNGVLYRVRHLPICGSKHFQLLEQWDCFGFHARNFVLALGIVGKILESLHWVLYHQEKEVLSAVRRLYYTG